MPHEAEKYLYDIQRVADLVAQFTTGKTFAEYTSDAMLRLAVERGLSIIGEALAQFARINPALAARISEHRRIIAFRNVVIHGYADVDDRLVWEVVETKLPLLRQEVAELLTEIVRRQE